MLRLPNLSSDECQGIRKSRGVLRIPGRLADGQLLTFAGLMRQRGHQGKQAQQGGGGARNGGIRPLTLSFDAQMGADFVKSDFSTRQRRTNHSKIWHGSRFIEVTSSKQEQFLVNMSLVKNL